MSSIYVKCKVLPGIFDSEFYVLVRDSSVYVDRHNVRVHEAPKSGQEVDGEVLAYIVEEGKDKVLVQLTGEPVVGGLRTWVEREAIAVPA